MKQQNTIPQFKHPEKDAVERYISLIYSKDSKLNKTENLDERKKEAQRLSGLKDESIINLENEAINKVIIEYLSQNSSLKFTLLITKQELLWEMITRLREPKQDKEDIADYVKTKDSIDDICDKLEKSVDNLYQHIFTAELKEAAMELLKVSLRPEERLLKAKGK